MTIRAGDKPARPRVGERYAIAGTLILKLNPMMQMKAEEREEAALDVPGVD